MITVQNLGKQYKIRMNENAYRTTFREAIAYQLKSIFRRKNKQPSEIKDFWALKDVSFQIEPGERVAIIGRNGAGKSTILKILSRITCPTTGNIQIKGKVTSLLEVGTGFHPELTGRENIYLNGAIMGMTRAEIKTQFDSIVDFSEVEQFLDLPVKRYSSGMYLRLGFAVAAHLRAEILIMDEVLAVGDVRFQKKCLGKINEVSKEGRTILFVSHNMSTVSTLCNKGILLDKGALVMAGSLEQCINLYLQDPEQMKTLSWKGKAGNHLFYVTCLQLIPQKSDSVVLLKGEKAVIHVEMVAQTDMKDMLMIFNICTLQGVPLMQRRVAPQEAEQFIFDLKKGNYQIQIEMDFSLFSEGRYILELDAGIHNVGRIVEHVQLEFEVVDGSRRFGDSDHILSPNWNWKFISINND